MIEKVIGALIYFTPFVFLLGFTIGGFLKEEKQK
jgi:hypothetical protein